MWGKTRLARRGWMHISSGQLEKIALAINIGETIYPESTVDRGLDKVKDNQLITHGTIRGTSDTRGLTPFAYWRRSLMGRD